MSARSPVKAKKVRKANFVSSAFDIRDRIIAELAREESPNIKRSKNVQQLSQARKIKVQKGRAAKARKARAAQIVKAQQIKSKRQTGVSRARTVKGAVSGRAEKGKINEQAVLGLRALADLMGKNIDPDALRITNRGFISSSNVVAVVYNSLIQSMFISFKNGAVYEYFKFPRDIYLKILRGEASAKTNDPKTPKMWWIGKTPSVGAAVWDYIRRSGRWADGSGNYKRIR